jgi:hypothetical protein
MSRRCRGMIHIDIVWDLERLRLDRYLSRVAPGAGKRGMAEQA